MHLLVNLLFLCFGTILVCAQNDGRYRPFNSFTTKQPVVINDGRYRPFNNFVTKKPSVINDGRYRPGNDGKYRPANDGKYRPGNDGKYIHIGDKDRGLYTGGGGDYTGGGGEYTGNGGKYTGGGGKYTGNGGQYTGSGGAYDGGFGKYNGGREKNIEEDIFRIDARFGEEPVATTMKPKAKLKYNQNSNTGEKYGWKIIRNEKTEDTDGYHYLYETENGILAEESGRIENLAPNEDGLRSKGFYQYIGDDGVLYRVDYVADNNGFVPQIRTDHITETPPAMQKLMDYSASQS